MADRKPSVVSRGAFQRRRGSLILFAALGLFVGFLAAITTRWSIGSLIIRHYTVDLSAGSVRLVSELEHLEPDPPLIAWRGRLEPLIPHELRWWVGTEQFGEGDAVYVPLWTVGVGFGLAGSLANRRGRDPVRRRSV